MTPQHILDQYGPPQFDADRVLLDKLGMRAARLMCSVLLSWQFIRQE
ncbi:hypothetical protein [Noviherbaspirillum sedimenti]|nr:hypothetical protein [Noviherbaspirillum sedimenti]